MIIEDIKKAKTALKLKKREFKLLLEAYRRKHFLDSNSKHDTDFLGLGTPAEYKSKYFTCSTGRPVARIRNWFKLTSEGEAMMLKLESLLPVDKYSKYDFNLYLFTY